MFSLRSNGLPCGAARTLRLLTGTRCALSSAVRESCSDADASRAVVARSGAGAAPTFAARCRHQSRAVCAARAPVGESESVAAAGERGRAQLVRSVAWLKRMNARGRDVFVAPACQHDLMLLDGLREEALGDMTGKGFAPAATIQTAPGQYQAWVKLSDRPISDDVRQHAYNGLARGFGPQPGHAEPGEHGRLAGFTCGSGSNDAETEGRFVLIRNAGGDVAKEAAALLAAIRRAMDKPEIQQKEMSQEKIKLACKQRGRSR
jgi:hypothetical protein